MKCQNCSRRCVPLKCNYCVRECCSSCIQLEIHHCEGLHTKCKQQIQELEKQMPVIIGKKHNFTC